jgi:hypothetical protein
VAFFDIKAKTIPPVIFLLILALYAVYFYIIQLDSQTYNFLLSQYSSSDIAQAPFQTSFATMAFSILIMLSINIVSFIYLDAAVRDASNMEYTAGDCFNNALKCFPRLTGVTIIKNIILAAGLFLFIIPGIYLAILLIFAECAILNRRNAVVESLKFSRTLTNKRRGEIFRIELFCNLIIAVFVILILSIFSSNNIIVFQYIMLFAISIVTLIEHKLVAHLYVDAITAYEGAIASAGGDNNT